MGGVESFVLCIKKPLREGRGRVWSGVLLQRVGEQRDVCREQMLGLRLGLWQVQAPDERSAREPLDEIVRAGASCFIGVE